MPRYIAEWCAHRTELERTLGFFIFFGRDNLFTFFFSSFPLVLRGGLSTFSKKGNEIHKTLCAHVYARKKKEPASGNFGFHFNLLRSHPLEPPSFPFFFQTLQIWEIVNGFFLVLFFHPPEQLLSITIVQIHRCCCCCAYLPLWLVFITLTVHTAALCVLESASNLQIY